MAYTVPQVRKAIVAWCGALAILANSLLTEFAQYISDDASHWVSVAVGVVTAIGVYLTRNAQVIDDLGTGRLPQTPTT